MLTKSLHDGLGEYEIGPKLRALRLRKRMSLMEVGAHSGLSAALLSKLERGLLFPTLPTLMRVALVFGVGLEFFFAGGRDKPVAVVRRSSRTQLHDQPGNGNGNGNGHGNGNGNGNGNGDIPYRLESLDYAATERRFNCYHAEFFEAAPETLRSHTHPGSEFIYIIEGTLSVRVHDTEHKLEAGDSMYFDSSVTHTYRRSGSPRCRAIVVTGG